MATDKTMSEKDWQARWDAETVANAESIKADPKRMADAKRMAGDMVKEKEEQMKKMQAEHAALSKMADGKMEGNTNEGKTKKDMSNKKGMEDKKKNMDRKDVNSGKDKGPSKKNMGKGKK